jgi:Cu2+-exporting ATPase
MRIATSTAVVEVSKMYRASSKAVVESALSRRPGVLSVDVNPVAQTATVIFDPDVTSIAEIAAWVHECGFQCAGCCVPWSWTRPEP